MITAGDSRSVPESMRALTLLSSPTGLSSSTPISFFLAVSTVPSSTCSSTERSSTGSIGFIAEGRAAWDRFSTGSRAVRAWEVQNLRDFPIGARMKFPDGAPAAISPGYVPCGYFQLWNAAATGYRDYPIDGKPGTAEGLGHDLLEPVSPVSTAN